MELLKTVNSVMPGDELMVSLAIAAAEAYEIGAEQNSEEFNQFIQAIKLTATAWDAHETSVSDTLTKLNELTAFIDAKDYNAAEDTFKETAVLAGGPSERGIQIIQKLRETAELLEHEQDRKLVEGVVSYIEDFWSVLS